MGLNILKNKLDLYKSVNKVMLEKLHLMKSQIQQLHDDSGLLRSELETERRLRIEQKEMFIAILKRNFRRSMQEVSPELAVSDLLAAEDNGNESGPIVEEMRKRSAAAICRNTNEMKLDATTVPKATNVQFVDAGKGQIIAKLAGKPAIGMANEMLSQYATAPKCTSTPIRDGQSAELKPSFSLVLPQVDDIVGGCGRQGILRRETINLARLVGENSIKNMVIKAPQTTKEPQVLCVNKAAKTLSNQVTRYNDNEALKKPLITNAFNSSTSGTIKDVIGILNSCRNLQIQSNDTAQPEAPTASEEEAALQLNRLRKANKQLNAQLKAKLRSDISTKKQSRKRK